MGSGRCLTFVLSCGKQRLNEVTLRKIMSTVAGFEVQVPNAIKLGHYTTKAKSTLVGRGRD